MFFKIGIALILSGTLTGWAAPLNSEYQNNIPKASGGFVAAKVIKPASAEGLFSTNSRWRGAKKVQKIIPTVQVPGKIGLSGISAAKAQDAARQPAAVLSGVAEKK